MIIFKLNSLVRVTSENKMLVVMKGDVSPSLLSHFSSLLFQPSKIQIFFPGHIHVHIQMEVTFLPSMHFPHIRTLSLSFEGNYLLGWIFWEI